MRFSIVSLFFLTALVAVLAWGIAQTRYIANIKSHSSVHIALIGKDQISYTPISDNDAVIVVGEATKARVVMTILAGMHTETLFEESLGPGKHTLWLRPIAKPSGEQPFGLSIHGRTHIVNGPWAEGRLEASEFILSANESKELSEALDFEPEARMYSYQIMLEALGEKPPVKEDPLAPPVP